MKLLRYTFKPDTLHFERWQVVNDVIQLNMTLELRKLWREGGYMGIAASAAEYFGINRIYRNSQSFITFEFTEPQWTWFVLRWL